MYVATERGTSDNTEATRFSQCAHDQRRRLEAEDCDSIRCAQLISGGRRRIRPPRCLAHARPTMCCIRLVIQETGNTNLPCRACYVIRNLYRNLLQPSVSSWIHAVLYGGCHSLDGCALARLSDMASTGTIIDVRAGSNIYVHN